MLRTACFELRRIIDAGHADFSMAVNRSRFAQFRHANFLNSGAIRHAGQRCTRREPRTRNHRVHRMEDPSFILRVLEEVKQPASPSPSTTSAPGSRRSAGCAASRWDRRQDRPRLCPGGPGLRGWRHHPRWRWSSIPGCSLGLTVTEGIAPRSSDSICSTSAAMKDWGGCSPTAGRQQLEGVASAGRRDAARQQGQQASVSESTPGRPR